MAKIFCWFAVFSACAIIAVIALQNQPPAFSFNRTINHFYHNAEGLPHRIASAVVRAGLASDWSASEPGPASGAPYPLLRSAASPGISYPYQTYDKADRPVALEPGDFRPPPGSRNVPVSSASEIVRAVHEARPGDVISIAPGTYDFERRSIAVSSAGTASTPIYLRAEPFGTVLINLSSLDGFRVIAPFWVFENLRIRGSCSPEVDCEHAIHVVGKARSFTLRNSELVNFNAAVKVNLNVIDGEREYPDSGLLEYNSFFNESRRNTAAPITPVNIDNASGWVVRGNYIADFAKAAGNRVSYGAFMKGNGRDGLFERNLVMCEHRLPADAGIRIGLSFGGGGSGEPFCRENSCATEHRGGVMRNNIILNCSRDVGIYLNRAAHSQIHNNLLYNNLGVDVRFDTASADISNNIISGRIKNRDGGQSVARGNYIARDCLGAARKKCKLNRIYQNPEIADFGRTEAAHDTGLPGGTVAIAVGEDFCGQSLPPETNVGPIQYRGETICRVGSSPEKFGGAH